MDKILEYLKQQKFWTNLLFVMLIFLFYVWIRMLTNTYITIQFDKLEPFEANMPVYYKGFKVGRTRNIKPSKDFKHTYISVVLNYDGLKLPKNTTAVVKKRDKGEYHKSLDYIELEYPDSPSIYYLKTGSIIKGTTSLDWNALISEQADNGELDNIAHGINDLLKNLNDTSVALTQIFTTVNDILSENRPNLLSASENLSGMAGNLYDVTCRINNSFSQKRLDNTFGSVEGTSKNFDSTSKNIDEITSNINDMMPYINATIVDVNSTVCNINQISAGILKTLQKRMGLMKLLVGKPIDK